MTRATFDPLGVHVVANESGTMCGAVDPSILAGERPTLGWHGGKSQTTGALRSE